MIRRRTIALIASPLLAPLVALLVAGCPNNDNGNDNANANDNSSTNGNDNAAVIKGDTGLTGNYVGSERCSLCHSNGHTAWAGTLHATALETLEAIGQGANASCVGCHTVGFGEAGGYVDRATTNSLAGVGCEACHGPAREHVENASDASLRPPINISASVCGKCHTDEHHPTFDDWSLSKHAVVEPELVPRFAAGTSLDTCGKCHSGDYFYGAIIKGETVPNNALAGLTSEQMNGITCVICHDPHQKTGNAVTPEDGRDYQLRYEQVKYTTPSTSIAAAQDPTRFNLCGQCHHARDRVWTDSSREPHPSDQVNVFFGELPVPDAKPEPIVASRVSVHLNAPEQCSTCHVFRKPIEEGVAPAVSGHTFEVNFEGCASCHGTAEIAESKFEGLKIELEYRTGLVKEALDNWATSNGKAENYWEYTSEGGPNAAGQAKIPDDIKKARYIYYYVAAGGGNGVHNPDFVREALVTAEDYARNAPAPLP